jgi:AcrR family transcriptional regulator
LSTATGQAAGAGRQRARRGEGEKLRGDIMAAAEQLLIETGDADKVSIRAITKLVGVTPPAVYMHFEDRDALIFEVCAARFEEFHDYLAAAFATSDDPVESLRAGGQAYIRFGLDHPEQYRMLFMSRHGEELAGRELEDMPGLSAFYLLVRAIQRCIEDELLRDDIDAFSASVSLWAGVHGLTSALISHPHFPFLPLERTVADLIDVHLRGLLRR